MSNETTASAISPASASQAPAKQETKPTTIREHLQGDAFKQAIAAALPVHLKPDRFIRIALTAMTRTPKLAQCDQASFFQALLSLSQYGLEPDGRRAHLIPFENRKRGIVECQLILDWKGIAELVYRSGVVSTLHADVVREGDLFDYSMGVLTTHVPHYLRRDDKKPEKEGDVFAAYSTATMKDGTRKTEVMSSEEIEGIRRRSRAGQSGPWVTDWTEMAKKTVFRRLSKWLPLSAELRDAVEADDDAIDIDATGKGSASGASSLTAMLADAPTEHEQSVDPAPEPEKAPVKDADAPPFDKQTFIDIIEGLMLDKEVSEEALAKAATEAGHKLPPKAKKLADLDEATLKFMADYLRGLKK